MRLPCFTYCPRCFCERGKKDEAAFWFYAGQLRARFDANRCADASARAAPGALNARYGPPINKYAFGDLAKLEALVPKVVEWDRKTPHNYDHRWINLHGMEAMMSGLSGDKNAERKPLSLPNEQWDKIAEDTRKGYLKDFKDLIAQFKGVSPPMGSYKLQHGEVFFRDGKVKDADAASFKFLGGALAKDKSHVFCGLEAVEGADPASYTQVGGDVGKDRKAIYFRTERCGECDLASFGKVSEDWYADKNAAYRAMGFRRIPVDRQSFTAINRWFAKDRHTVFYMTKPVPGADAASFKLASCGEVEVIGEDKNRCYWNSYPVTCGCEPRAMGEIPSVWTSLQPGMSVLAQAGPVSISSVQGTREGGYFVVARPFANRRARLLEHEAQ